MATLDAPGEAEPAASRTDRLGAWMRWWVSASKLDWGFAAFSTALVGAGYYDAWLNRHPPPPGWEHVPSQAAWLAITLYLGVATLLRWMRDRRLDTMVPDGYGLSVAGCAIFLAGIVVSGWWADAFGQDFGVPAIFRVPNLMEIAGAALIVTGPFRASATRGELMAGPTAVVSVLLVLATVTFFTQFDHPYIDQFAAAGPAGVIRPSPTSPSDLFNNREEILGALGLMVQAAVVTGVILWTLRQTRLPVGGITLMVTGTAFLAATQHGHFETVAVAFAIGVVSEAALILVRPRADRVPGMRLFAVTMGALLGGIYLLYIGLGPGTWWPPDMTYGTVLACALAGGLMSYAIFPGADATRAASVLWPALAQDSPAESPDVTVERVEHALKVLHSTRDLAESPLIGMHCVASPTPADLRGVIESAIEHLRSSQFQQDAQAGQILDLYYVRRIGGHYAVHTRVGLSRAAYFNRRSYGVRRLVDRLRELEESAQPA